MAVINMGADQFNTVISENDIVLVDFWAEWCAPCKSFAPVYEQVAEKHPDIVFAKVDTEAEQELAAHFQIRSIPTVMVLREQIVLFAQPGAMGASQLEEVIQKVRDLDMEKIHADIEQQGQLS